jgi:uncharacterized protein YPO0396
MTSQDSVTERCRQIAEKLDRSAQHHPREIEKEIDEVERELVRLRDELIIERRREDPAAASEPGQTKLTHINVALSLVVAVEYPVTSIQRTALKQARDVLQNC